MTKKHPILDVSCHPSLDVLSNHPILDGLRHPFLDGDINHPILYHPFLDDASKLKQSSSYSHPVLDDDIKFKQPSNFGCFIPSIFWLMWKSSYFG